MQTLNSWATGASLPRDLDRLVAVGEVLARWAREAAPDARHWAKLMAADQAGRPRSRETQAPSYGGLPNKVRDLVGRERETAELLGALGAGADGPPVILVVGMPGVGKSALVTNAAHLAVEQGRFPGGVVFVELSGYDPENPVSGDQAVRMALRQLGVSDEEFEPTAKGLQAQFRRRLDQRREATLIVLDDAASDGQVVPLIPGTGPHRVVVTSRNSLDNHNRLRDVAKISLEVLSVAASIQLLGLADRDARHAGRLAELCGGLPLALQIVAAVVRADPERPAADLVAELAVEHQRLEALDRHDSQELGVRATLALSCAKLPGTHQRLLRLLSLNPRHELGERARREGTSYVPLPEAAALAGEPPAEVRRSLVALARAHLLEYVVWERSRHREYWRLHDLVLLYFRESASATHEEDGASDAMNRWFDHWLRHRMVNEFVVEIDDGDTTRRLTWREQLGDMVAVGDRDDPLYPRAGFVWDEEQQCWVNPDQSPLDVASRLLREAERSGDRPEIGLAKAAYGTAWLRLGETDAAVQVLGEAVAILDETGDREAHDRALADLALALVCHEQVEQVREVLDRISLDDVRIAEHVRAAEGHRAKGVLWMGFGQLLRMRGRSKEAISPLNKAAAEFRASGFRRDEGFALGNLGWALRECSIFGEGQRRLREAKAILDAEGVTEDSVRVHRLSPPTP